MNKHISMFDVIQAGADETVRLSPRQFGEADDTYTIRTEDRAMEVYFKAEAEFLSKVQDAWALTDLCKDEMQSVMDAVHDHRISKDAWEEKART